VTRAAFVDVPSDGRVVSIEHQWLNPAPLAAARREGARSAAPRQAATHTADRPPLMVFLHEGLGSRAMWKHYPQALCDALGFRGLAFSRAGYGRSTPRAPDERWGIDFMHRQAQAFLPRFLAALGVDDAPWLFGHSDGASIALIYAATFPGRVAGVVAVAPHIMVEDLSIRSIEAARDAYRLTDIKARLARYHDDPDSAFWGWNDAWLDPRFRAWSIEAMLPRLACPILAIQGADDEYGTLAQVEGIRARAPQAEVVVLPECGHSPHRDQPAALTAAVADFVTRHSRRSRSREECHGSSS
jgi:pimeloyl-ACP methyl ester carboxylesterase